MKRRTIQILFGIFLSSLPLLVKAEIHYVKVGGTGDGSSWDNASGDLQAIINDANHGDDIWIAEGNYYPVACTNCSEADRDSSFQITKRLTILGGFPASGCVILGTRDWINNPTILSGDIGISGDNSDNSYNVLNINFSSGWTTLDGIIIEDGNANGSFDPNTDGAGIHLTNGNTRLKYCAFYNNSALGNGAAFFSGSNKAEFDFCTFENNNADSGAAIYINSESRSPITNCAFRNNIATTNGGAIYLGSKTHVRIFGCLFHENSATSGGAVYLENPDSWNDGDPDDDDEATFSRSKVMNCTFVNNNASLGGSCVHISILQVQHTITNTILWANQHPNFEVENGGGIYLRNNLTDSPNLDALGNGLSGWAYFNSSDPFNDLANNDFTLFSESMAANRGYRETNAGNCDDSPYGDDNQTYELESDFDLLGHDREVTRTKPDIGAYEFYDSNPYIPILYVNKNATGGNNGLSWTDAYTSLEDAFKKARNYIVKEIWVASGTYQPSNCAFSNCQNPVSFKYDLIFRNSGSLVIYGGFPNSGNPTLADRDWNNYSSIISGDIGVPDTLEDNIEELMYQSYFSKNNVILDGLTFSGARTFAVKANEIKVKNCTFTNNTLGLEINTFLHNCYGHGEIENCDFLNNERAIYVDKEAWLKVKGSRFLNNNNSAIKLRNYAGLVLSNCEFINNHSISNGGAIFWSGSSYASYSINACSFINNTSVEDGGAIYLGISKNLNITNSLFSQNSSEQGGAIRLGYKNNAQFTNCTFYNNIASDGGSICLVTTSGTAMEFRNSIVWEQNTPFSGNYSAVFRNTLSDFNHCADPGSNVSCFGPNYFDSNSPFVDEGNQNFHLNDSNLAINLGDNIFVDTTLHSYDLANNLRINDVTVDMGAYEYDADMGSFFDLDNDGFLSNLDCDDNDPNVNPFASEFPYNGIDDDCDPGTLDDDLDQDGFGIDQDCDDNNPLVNPDAIEIPYNNYDDDCNAATLNDDLDQDGFGIDEDCNDNDPNINPCSPSMEIIYNGSDDDCDPGTLDDDLDQDGYILAEDCDDNNPLINPGVTEIPFNGIDDDCNEATLDNDSDQDGSPDDEDCDDNDPLINPDATEIPYNGIDEDCNEATPDDDLDQDGFGIADDCDDNNSLANPGVAEIPYNGFDDDCDPGTFDDDLDQDGFGIAEDCDDNNELINPAATEIPFNGIDDDCNEETLDDDSDQDGFGIADDCDDNDPLINPDATEIPYNGIDEDCNEATPDDDLDQDGFGIADDCDDNNSLVNPGTSEIPYNFIDDDCNVATLDDDLDQDGFNFAQDCDDNNPFINPDATEIPYNGLDDDCDEATLDDDLDQDGFNLADDCDDNNPNIPTTPGSSCDDGDANTYNDVFLSDGCTCQGNIFVEGPVFEWANQLGGNSIDEGKGIATDSWGNVYLTGYFEQTVDFNPGPDVYNLTAVGNDDIFVSKFNANGELVWAYSFGDFDVDWGAGIATDTFGNVVVTGYFEGTIDFDPGPGTFNLSTEERDIFILKLNTDGNFIWAKNMGGPGDDTGRAIVVDESGNVFTTGRFQETADFDPGAGVYNLSSHGETDIFVSKLDSEGNFVWAKPIGGDDSDQGNSIALDNENNVLTTGFFRNDAVDFNPGTGQYFLTASGGSDMFVSKLNSEGDFVWAKNIGGSESQRGLGIATANNNEVYITGYFSGSVDFDPGSGVYNLSSSGERDIYILKLDSYGNYDWVRSFGAAGNDKGFALTLDENNNVYVTGDFTGTIDFDPGQSNYYLTSAGEQDVFVLKLSPAGSFIWAGSFKGNSEDNAGYAIALDDWENIYTTGFFQSTVDFDPDIGVYELSSHGEHDAFIHKMRQQPCNAKPVINNCNPSYILCPGDSIALTAEIHSWVEDIIYAWDTGETSSSIVVAPDFTSIYTIHVYYLADQVLCYNSSSVEVNVIENDTTHFEFTSCDSMDVGSTIFGFLDQYGCDSIVVENTTLSLAPEMPVAPDDILIQENEPPFQITVSEVPNATSYEWVVPPGVQILSGAGTNSITVDWGGMTTGGPVCVNAINECGTSLAACIEVAVDISDGLNDIDRKTYSIFPNPTGEVLNVVFDDRQTYEITFLDVLGKVVIPPVRYSGHSQIEVIQLPSAIYWLKINKEGEVFWERVEVLH